MSYTPALLAIILVLVAFLLRNLFLQMPGAKYVGPFSSLSPVESDVEGELKRMLRKLAGEIGERNVQRTPAALKDAAAWIQSELLRTGYQITRQEVVYDRKTNVNLEVTLSGTNPDLPPIIVGAHYDTVELSPGANDNGSAVAANLMLAKLLAQKKPVRSIKFVFFVNEESPWFMTESMGSLVYAKSLADQKKEIMGMICLETIGYYSDAPGSQKYPWPLGLFYPSRGNFVAFISNSKSRTFLYHLIGAFRHKTLFPSEGAALPEMMRDICQSDHFPFWKHGFNAVMITDTANFRYPYYHTAEDTADKICYDRLARITVGLADALIYMARR